MLEVRMRDIQVRVPYGVNGTGPDRGAVPNLIPKPVYRVVKIDRERRVALFSEGIEVPLAPFMGIVAVAPPPALKRVNTRPPGAYGGNMDFRFLTAGSTLYLPVFNEGALLYTGDGHGAQGDGEVDGAAIEISLAPTFEVIVHPGAGRTMKWPRAEDATHFYLMGMDESLDRALEEAVAATVAFLGERFGLDTASAYALSSLAVDFRVGEAVNHVKMVYGAIPKRIFTREFDYWRS